jgi:hypothetical protein
MLCLQDAHTTAAPSDAGAHFHGAALAHCGRKDGLTSCRMAPTDRTPFGALLKHDRRAAGLLPDPLAESVGLSVRGLSDLERGISTPSRRHRCPAGRRPRAVAAGYLTAMR